MPYARMFLSMTDFLAYSMNSGSEGNLRTPDDHTPLRKFLLALKQIFIEVMERFLYINPLYYNNSIISAPSVLAMLRSPVTKIETMHNEGTVKLVNIYAVFRLPRLQHLGRLMSAILLTIDFAPCSKNFLDNLTRVAAELEYMIEEDLKVWARQWYGDSENSSVPDAGTDMESGRRIWYYRRVWVDGDE
ncbi:hypothetical protein LTR56_013594 [Elasticomyces elasticus]|nr:hypothetical protein LTR56_013594 [Elasticomyces elasticus]KAK3651058.1 hypothetical protein LTR22_012306 [Elasticomyces elasticus]KAK4931136.1 hypothetical protein LTR49_002552 [Elasticomyces elasticus]KAK5765604.1 hypothetical protein LTS12_004356 [Elasticomyces elasticus]